MLLYNYLSPIFPHDEPVAGVEEAAVIVVPVVAVPLPAAHPHHLVADPAKVVLHYVFNGSNLNKRCAYQA